MLSAETMVGALGFLAQKGSALWGKKREVRRGDQRRRSSSGLENATNVRS